MRWLILPLVIGLPGFVHAVEDVDYLRDIKPLLLEKCGACHGALEQNVGLRLDAGQLLRKGSDVGPVITPGRAADSLLIRKVTAQDADERMPPPDEGEPLTDRQVLLLSAWIDGGAVFPEDEGIPVDPRQHWAYQPPRRSSLPPIRDTDWSHPIDAFLAHEHRRLALTPVETADRYTLLRRLYLDLIGLPPTPQQLQAFVEDELPDAWERVVDALLASPHYGERWGRHWMDVWRYSDWDGYKNELRGSQRHIWRWRDWIVGSLNEDKGYDRMIVEMLAGDEVAPDDNRVLPATGFLARNFHKSNRNIWLDATVEHTAKAFLGLTLNCARCHDHKYDPISQSAYYQFRAIFEPHNVRTDRIPGQADVVQDGLPRVFDADPSAETFLFLQGDDRQPDKEHPLTPALPAVLGGSFEIQAVDLPIAAYYPSLQNFVLKMELADVRQQLASAEKTLHENVQQRAESTAQEQLQPNIKILEQERNVAQLRVVSLVARQAADQAKFTGVDAALTEKLAGTAAAAERQLIAVQAELTVLQKQQALEASQSSAEKDAKKKNAAVKKAQDEIAEAQQNHAAAIKALSKTDGEYTPIGKTYPRQSSGRRLALARWIASRDNALTARVAVNHIWLRHFGSPLVDNVFDFGLRSPRPRHADLLDWLAVEFMDNGWQMKHLHRLIVTSRTWCLASSGRTPVSQRNRTVDGDNQYLWRMNARRLDAELIRDNVLAVAGRLDSTLGGPDINFRDGETSRRRSIYLGHAYEKQMMMLVLFDAASPNECYRRSESIIPQQALALTNSSLSLGQSRLLARHLWQQVSASNDQQHPRFIKSAFLQILSRFPADDELSACLQFISEQTEILSDQEQLTTFAGGSDPVVPPASEPEMRALQNLVHVLMNHNAFVTVR